MNRIQSVARAAIDAADGDDIAAAKQLVKEQAATDGDLSAALLDYAIDIAIDAEWRAGRQARWNSTRLVIDSPEPEPSFGAAESVERRAPLPSTALAEGMRLAIASVKERLLDYEMEPGKRIGDCTKPEILTAAGRMAKQAETMQLRSEWLMAVAGLLPDNRQKVRAVLREADLERVRRRVLNKHAA